MSSVRARAASTGALPPFALALSIAAWAVLLLLTSYRGGSHLYASSMTVSFTAGSLVAFLVGWEVMVVAMMLPSSVRFLVLFRAMTSDRPGRRLCRAAVGAGYLLTWVVVGWVVLVVSGAVHRATGVDAWLEVHAGLFAGGVLVLAGIFQLTPLKRRCLSVCSHPHGFLMRHYRRGAIGAIDLGARYGILCVGCCWALMVVIVVLGASNLYAMLVLSTVMFAERALGWDERFVRVIGLACVVLGAAVAVEPGAVPALAHNARMWGGMGSFQLRDLTSWCHG